MDNIRYVKHREIDIEQWDYCITQAFNCRLYAMSWYLNLLASDWDALIYNNYEHVMPVLKGRKFFLNYIYQPIYAQQHGIFPDASPEVTRYFLQKLSSLSSYIQIAMNSANTFNGVSYEITKKPNYILKLNSNYENIRNAYNKHTKRYTKKALKNVVVENNVAVKRYIDFKQQEAGDYLKPNYLLKLQSIITEATRRDICEIYAAKDQKGELCAGAVFIKGKRRIYYLNGVSSGKGLNNRAMFAVFDRFFYEHQLRPEIFDFEGSAIDGVARFFAGFGAEPEYYPVLKKNTLPFFIKMFIKEG